MAVTVEQQKAIALAKARRARSESMQGGQSAMGVAKNLGAGLVEGVAAIPTAPRDIGMLAGQGVTYGIDRLRGLTPEQASAEQQRVRQQSQMYEQSFGIPSPLSLIQRGYESYVKPMLPEAKTTPEKYARTIGQFAPAALSPGSALQRTANVVIPAVASEAAGQATEGTSAEPVARLVGGLVGGRLATPRTTAIKETAKLSPSQQKLAKNVRQSYADIENAGVYYDPRVFKQKISNLNKTLMDKSLDIGAEGIVKDMQRFAKSNKSRLTPSYITEKFSELGSDILANPSASPKEKRAAGMARDALMDILESSPLVSPKGLSGTDLAAMNKKARELAAASLRSEAVGRRVQKGLGAQAGVVSGIRNQMTSLANKLIDQKGAGWSPMEREALALAAKGKFTTNALNILGKFGFGGGSNAALIPGLGAAGGFGVAGMGLPGIMGALAVPAAGSLARFGAGRMTKSQADLLQKVLRAGRTGQAAGLSSAERKNAEALIRQLVSSGQGAALGLLDEEQ